MPTTNTEGVLVYTNESRGFKYTEGEYELTGNKVSQNSVMKSVDGGTVMKAGEYLGNFNVRFESSKPKFSVNNIDADDYLAVFTALTNLLAKLAEE